MTGRGMDRGGGVAGFRAIVSVAHRARQEQAEILLKARIISAIPDWSKALQPEFVERARAGT